MTEIELNKVRELHKVIKDGERQIKALREVQSQTVPARDGQPTARNTQSQVELLTILIVDGEKQLEQEREQLRALAAELLEKLQAAELTAQEFTIMKMRYIACLRFRDIQFRLHVSDSFVFRTHRQALRKLGIKQIDLQNR